MALFKREGSEHWQTRFTVLGKEVRRSTGTSDKKLAKEYEDKLKSETWRIVRLGERPRFRWEQAVERWLTEKGHLNSIRDRKISLRWLHQHLKGKCIDEITRDLTDSLIQLRKAEGVSNATVNRTMEVLRAILKSCVKDWGWLQDCPNIRMLPEEARRVRFLTKEEALRLLEALPTHLSEMARFSLYTGLRKENVVSLQWSQVDLERRVAWLHHDQTKNKKAYSIPLNSEAVLVLRRQLGKHEKYVFTYKRKPVSNVNTKTWRKCLKDCGIENFRWHDLRHTWASWHVMSGTPLQVLMELGKWSSIEMVLRYAHLSAGHIAEHAGNIGKLVTVSGTSSTPQTPSIVSA